MFFSVIFENELTTAYLLGNIMFYFLQIYPRTAWSGTGKSGQVLVNQPLIESNIQAVQPAENIYISIQTTNDHDSILIVKLKVSPKTPVNSLNAAQAKLVIASFITILPSMRDYRAYKVIFLKKGWSDFYKVHRICASNDRGTGIQGNQL
jgi:hypothetical protein